MIQTGLVKVCPRCCATGRVLIDRDSGSPFVIVWSDGLRTWRDTSVGLDLVLDPEMGCGYDGANIRESQQHREYQGVGKALP